MSVWYHPCENDNHIFMKTDTKPRTLEVEIKFEKKFSNTPKVLYYFSLLNLERHSPTDIFVELLSVNQESILNKIITRIRFQS